MKPFISLNILTAILLFSHIFSAKGYAGDSPVVVASIPPIHALLSGVMADVAEPYLFVKGGSSPHTYAMRPSERQKLQQAQAIFWIGEEMERFLVKPLELLPQGTQKIALSTIPGIQLLPMREGGLWEPHLHHEEEAHNKGHDQHDEHDHHEADMHLWLDPVNARVMVKTMSTVLSDLDPAHAKQYQDNALAIDKKLEKSLEQLKLKLAPVQHKPYIVFHDAYHYFEQRFGLTSVGSITLNPERKPGAKRVQQIRQKILEGKAICLFAEPQFEPTMIDSLIHSASVPIRKGVLDPLGNSSPESREMGYFNLLDQLADSLVTCLQPSKP